MFIGHYGVSFAAKRLSPRLSLGILFLAVQLLDVLFAIFVLTGTERMNIVHGFTAYNPYDLYWMPYTHSLAGALFWSALTAGVCWIAARRIPPRPRRRAALVLGGAVFSHFVLDVPMHTPDMALWPGPGAPKIGLGLWNHPFASVLAELAVFGAGAWTYLRHSRPMSGAGRVGTIVFVAFLAAVTVSTPFQPDPASPPAFAVFALVSYLVLAIVAGLVDRRRRMTDGGAGAG